VSEFQALERKILALTAIQLPSASNAGEVTAGKWLSHRCARDDL
jgi:hypothetical protein